MKRLTIFAFLFVFASWLAVPNTAQAASSGSLIKASGPAVYYVWDGKRYVFPNEHIYFSWYDNFDLVEEVTGQELASYLIGGNVTYKPGSKLLKIQTDPKVYAVGRGGVLKWITSEEVATTLYGPGWSKQVHDVSDAYFLDYRQGDAIAIPQDFNVVIESASVGIFEDITLKQAPQDDVTDAPTVYRAIKSGNWSEKITWGGEIPVSGSEVNIPLGINVTYDAAESGSLKYLEINGHLIFDPTKNTKLTSKRVDVKGRLAMGTAEEPISSNKEAILLISGASPFTIADDGMRVTGFFEAHGSKPEILWTKLASPAASDATEIILQEEVDWKPGDKIVLASGDRDYQGTEIRNIIFVDGTLVELDEPLAKSHRADQLMSSEVGLLSRNVKIIGLGSDQGSYVSFSGRAEANIDSVEFSGLGRRGVVGHYPLYFDGLGTASDTYLRNSSIHSSGNRCLTIRQTNKMEISGLVAANIKGHCIATVEGAESELILTGNMISGITEGDAKTSDITPAAFYIRNPDAVIIGNSVSGSAGHGYWYELPREVVKSDGSLLRPRDTDLGVFSGNTAHSNLGTGLIVDDEKGEMNYSPATTAVFSGYSGIMNDQRGFWMRGSNLEVSDSYLADNKIGGTFSAFGAELKNSLVVGNPNLAGASLASEVGENYQLGFTFNDGPVNVSGVTFRDFVSTEGLQSAAFGFHHANQVIPDPRNSFTGITFENSNEWYALPPTEAGDYLSVAKDLDLGTTIVVNDPFLDNGCELEEGDTVLTCAGRYSQILVIFRDAPGKEDAHFERLDTGAKFTLKPGPAFDGKYAYMTISEGSGYRIYGPTTRDISFDFSGSVEPVLLRFSAPETASVRINGSGAEFMPWPDLIAGKYGYDLSTDEVVLYLPADGFADINW